MCPCDWNNREAKFRHRKVHSVAQHLKVKPELFPEENKRIISYCLKGPEDLKRGGRRRTRIVSKMCLIGLEKPQTRLVRKESELCNKKQPYILQASEVGVASRLLEKAECAGLVLQRWTDTSQGLKSWENGKASSALN